MMGTKERDFRSLPDDISLEGLVPKDNLYRLRLIANSSLFGNQAGMGDCERDANQHGGIIHMRRNPSRGVAWG